MRAVRLLGVRPAMDLMLTGKTLRAERALPIGLIDRLVAADEAERPPRQLLRAAPAPHRPPLLERLLSLPGIRALLAPALHAAGCQARPQAITTRRPTRSSSCGAATARAASAAFQAEAGSDLPAVPDPTARNLVRVFQLQDRLKALGAREAAGRRCPLSGACT